MIKRRRHHGAGLAIGPGNLDTGVLIGITLAAAHNPFDLEFIFGGFPGGGDRGLHTLSCFLKGFEVVAGCREEEADDEVPIS